MTERPSGKGLLALLAKHELVGTPPEIVDALAARIRWIIADRARPEPALRSRERTRAIHCAEALLRHIVKPPRRQGATDDRCGELIALLDAMSAVVKVTASTGRSVTPILERLKLNRYSPEDVSDLITTLRAMEPGTGAARLSEPYVPLLRGGVMAWEACGRLERYARSAYTGEVTGPLPAFLRDLIDLAKLEQPNDEVLRGHLRVLKNM